MTTARRNTLRTIFRCAWNAKRANASRSFTDCLKTAWAEHKAREAYFAQVAATPANQLRRLAFKSTIVSPVERAVRRSGNRYAYTEARDRSRLTTTLGI